MATIKPFQAVRPRTDLASRIAALPYDVYSRAEARKAVEENPYSFLKIDRAETQFVTEVDLYSPQVYHRASDTLYEMLEKGEFVKEEHPCFYIYELTMNGRVQTGIAACASVAEYERQTIKKHENTRVEKENDRIRHVDACSAQTGPIFLAYRYREKIAAIQEEEKKRIPLYDFTASDGIRHRLWVVEEPKIIHKIQRAFEKVDTLYIADGHHRAASAAQVAKMRRQEERHFLHKKLHPLKLPEYEYFLSVLFADRDLMVMDYNRWVKNLGGKSKESFLEQLGEKFSCIPLESAAHPEQKGHFTMYLDHQWYSLEEKTPQKREDVVACLDVSVLQNEVLQPILGIENPKTDQRIGFIGGIRGLLELERLVNEHGGVAFAMYPTSMEELFQVADAGRLMPPKSTWFEPKLRSGLLIHLI